MGRGLRGWKLFVGFVVSSAHGSFQTWLGNDLPMALILLVILAF